MTSPVVDEEGMDLTDAEARALAQRIVGQFLMEWPDRVVDWGSVPSLGEHAYGRLQAEIVRRGQVILDGRNYFDERYVDSKALYERATR